MIPLYDAETVIGLALFANGVLLGAVAVSSHRDRVADRRRRPPARRQPGTVVEQARHCRVLPTPNAVAADVSPRSAATAPAPRRSA